MRLLNKPRHHAVGQFALQRDADDVAAAGAMLSDSPCRFCMVESSTSGVDDSDG